MKAVFNSGDSVSGERLELSKRCYLPFKVKVKCPECGSINIDDYSDMYLSYPVVGSVEERFRCCEKCDSDIAYDVKVLISLEVEGDCVMGDSDE